MSNKTKTLPPVRVNEALHNAVLAVAVAQDVSVGQVIRLALLDYCLPKHEQVSIPVVGELSSDMNWDDLALEFRAVKKEFQDQVEALALSVEEE